MTDSMLTDAIYSKYFSDLPRESFDRMLVSEPP
jgi:BarA-like signal transduction histidine kinase